MMSPRKSCSRVSPRALATALAGAAVIGACASTPGTPDAAAGTRSLSVLGAGPDIGIKPGKSQKLRVRYTTASGAALAGERVRFAIFGDPQGSALLADSAITSDDGVVAVEVRAGAVAASFRVRASAALAEDLLFYVEVSGAGFGTLQARASYEGARARGALGEIDYWLYKERSCGEITDAQNPPGDVARRRAMESAEKPVVFRAMAVLVGYSLFARGVDAQNRVLAAGCVDLPRTLIRPEQEVSLTVRLTDVLPPAAGDYAVTTAVLLPASTRPLARALLPWADLVDCAADPVQLLLDCVLDALDADDPLDCVVAAPSARTAAIVAERGLLGPDGCRGELTARRSPALEQSLGQRLEEGATLRPRLVAVEAAALEMLRRVDVNTVLTLSEPDRTGALVASHRLAGLTFRASERKAVFDAAVLGVPAPIARAVPARLAGWQVTLGDHALSVGYGLAAREAMGELVLVPATLPATSTELAAYVADAIAGSDAGALRGCPALEDVVCKAARLGPGCLGPACAAGLAALGRYLDSGFAALERPASSLSVRGSAALSDEDRDGTVDRVGGEAEGRLATWTDATLHLADEPVAVEKADFRGERVEPR